VPPPLALAATIVGCAFLIWRDSRRTPGLSGALWLPIIWFFLVGSRFFSQWLSLFGLPGGETGSLEDGNPIDAVFFAVLIAAGIVVLYRRRVALSEIARQNVWLTVFLVYCLLAILWSDFPFIAFKRWIKILGHPVMALIILTAGNHLEAVRRVLKRTTYLLIPFSVLCIKYYPQVGRYFDEYTGRGSNRGIQLNKNELGYVCMVFGLFFFWNFLSLRRLEHPAARREETLVSVAFLTMIAWLLAITGSATSLACTAVGILTMLIAGTRMVRNRIWTWVVVTLLFAAVGEAMFGIYARVIDLLGRDPTLTDRTRVWRDLLATDINPVLGAGFESFWLGARREAIWSKWWWQPIQAHNGYIETYLNLGWLGLLFLGGLLLATFEKSRRELTRDKDWGRFRLGILAAILVYNYTEASFRALSLVWTIFHLIAIDPPVSRNTQSRNVSAGPRGDGRRPVIANRAAIATLQRSNAAAVDPVRLPIRARR
jgi:O-antigen ligase